MGVHEPESHNRVLLTDAAFGLVFNCREKMEEKQKNYTV